MKIMIIDDVWFICLLKISWENKGVQESWGNGIIGLDEHKTGGYILDNTHTKTTRP